ncbi:MAG TPA: xanthine dehydrogenase family protein subunit M [Pyrinomonadaceae bacterium]|jgi:CO/xanthine dehydrogenase FAD-binding subunit|nr:xanthine dehydrogenase family protein subunit M [Pyrinomonadaceae bacterium]
MRAYLPSYEMVVPRTLDEALALLRDEPGVWRPFAGGTDLMVLLEAGRLEQRKFFSIAHLKELRGVGESGEFVTLGALTTYTDVRRSETIAREFPMLVEAARETGGVAIQNRGTVGGNIANASPAADTPPALLAYGAEVELVSAAGERRVDYAEFHTGYRQTVMRADELIARVRLRRPSAGARHFYRKVGTRRAQAISKVCFAALAEVGEGGVLGEVRIALGSVAPTVVRCRETEGLMRGRVSGAELSKEAADALARDIAPIDDVRSTARYRLRVAQNLLAEFLSGAPATK